MLLYIYVIFEIILEPFLFSFYRKFLLRFRDLEIFVFIIVVILVLMNGFR